MTREEASTILYKEWQRFLEDNLDYAGISDAYTMAINTLKQEPCGDAINRDELLKAIDTWDKFGCDADTKLVPYQDHYIPYIHYDDVVKCIKGMPSVTPQPKTGHWNAYEVFQGGIKEEWLECSECKWSNALVIPRNYCPKCGARMMEKEDDEE